MFKRAGVVFTRGLGVVVRKPAVWPWGTTVAKGSGPRANGIQISSPPLSSTVTFGNSNLPWPQYSILQNRDNKIVF